MTVGSGGNSASSETDGGSTGADAWISGAPIGSGVSSGHSDSAESIVSGTASGGESKRIGISALTASLAASIGCDSAAGASGLTAPAD